MLDRDPDAAIAEIEAALRRDDPDFVARLEGLDHEGLRSEELGSVRAETDLLDWPPIDLDALLGADGDEDVDDAVPAPAGRTRTRGAVAWSLLAVVAAVAITLAVTVAVGPNLGGLVGVVTITAAGMYAYQALRGCPGRR